jgi:predicted phosphoadenosine phosphosulfate sulfurtransferase
MQLKKPISKNVLTAAKERISFAFDNFEKILLSFSGGKDSSVMFHLVMEEAIQRNRKIGVMLIDFEAQYQATSDHANEMFDLYKDHIDLHWICLPIKLRNAVSNYQPTWTCWDSAHKNDWVRQMPSRNGVISDLSHYPFFVPNLEFEEFIIMFADWYSAGKPLATFVGIRADESLNRFRTIAIADKETYQGKRWTTKVVGDVYNIYPIYDWKTKDIWIYNRKSKKCYNRIYDLMHQAGVPLSQQRLCQPYGDDQRKGLWLYHILEPQSWFKVVSRVNGANSGALYINETGNINGVNKISLPPGHTYKSFCNLLLSTLPEISRNHFFERFKDHIKGWRKRGYRGTIPDKAPRELESKHWVPSWRRLCKVLLRNDWWCKGLGMTQPKSEAYGKFLQMKKTKKYEPTI